MTPINELLSRLRLVDDPVVPADVVPCDGSAAGSGLTWPPPEHRDREAAVEDLITLCEAAVARSAVTTLRNFDTERLPAPPGARTLSCILRLAGDQDGARVWWQYAAGAGDDAASYCLFLHHLSRGESDLAAWWRDQTHPGSWPHPEETPLPGTCEQQLFDAGTRTALRVLRALTRTSRNTNEFIEAVMEYVPNAVTPGYVYPGLEMPLPPTDFADHIGIILAVTTAYTTAETRPRSADLPDRAHHPYKRPPQSKPRQPRYMANVLADFDTLANGLLIHD